MKPTHTTHFAYVVFDLDGQALYVGATTNLHERMLDHKRRQPWADRIGDVTYWQLDSRDQSLTAEYLLIQEHKPLHNVIKRKLPPLMAATLKSA